MLYKCIKRIFNRPAHSCLSSDNKPKVVEVLLKFAKLYDYVDFEDERKLKQNFSNVLKLDFLQFKNNEKPITDETHETIVDGYNQTPEKF